MSFTGSAKYTAIKLLYEYKAFFRANHTYIHIYTYVYVTD